MKIPQVRTLHACVVLVCLGAASSPAAALDLTVTAIEVNQAVQYGTTKLIGNNVTWVRVKVGVGGSAGAVSGVDAALRMSINGVQQPLPPTFSLNGPITAPLSPNSANINDTINFAVLPPVGNNITFTVEVNPNRNPIETNYANNTMSVIKVFECRKMLECAYVPINYTFNGAGLPLASLIEPGVGDGFLRGIYHPGEWNYHKSPLPALNWSSNINTTSGNLQNALLDIRNNQLPANGQPRPNFVYGWLPGNPYSGNGQANGVPGDVAFGNSDTSRHQRTFAHELGHLLGRSHISQTINTIGVDVEHHLKDTQNLAQIMPSTKNDIMVAGLVTNQAWVWQGTYDAVHSDARMQCGAPAPDIEEVAVLRVSGVIENDTRAIALDAVMRIERALPTSNDPEGDTTVIAYDDNGVELTRVTVTTDSAREMCCAPVRGKPLLEPRSPLYVMLPETIAGEAIHTIKVVDRATARVTATQTRTANAPTIALHRAGLLGAVGDADARTVRVEWAGADEDGDELTYTLLYSPDHGESWLPLVVNTPKTEFEYSADDVPADRGNPILRLVATDGMNITQADYEPQAAGLGGGGTTPPETFLISPNNAAVFPQHAPIAFHGTSWDKEDQLLTGIALSWTSNLDGTIGSGMLFICDDLSPGTHVITIKGTDTSETSTTRFVSITITPRTVISADCNSNGILDSVDISNGNSTDANSNGVPDECDMVCSNDIAANGAVDVNDLLAVINAWGACPGSCPPSCPADVDHTCSVDVADLLSVVNGWGPCP